MEATLASTSATSSVTSWVLLDRDCSCPSRPSWSSIASIRSGGTLSTSVACASAPEPDRSSPATAPPAARAAASACGGPAGHVVDHDGQLGRPDQGRLAAGSPRSTRPSSPSGGPAPRRPAPADPAGLVRVPPSRRCRAPRPPRPRPSAWLDPLQPASTPASASASPAAPSHLVRPPTAASLRCVWRCDRGRRRRPVPRRRSRSGLDPFAAERARWGGGARRGDRSRHRRAVRGAGGVPRGAAGHAGHARRRRLQGGRQAAGLAGRRAAGGRGRRDVPGPAEGGRRAGPGGRSRPTSWCTR